MQKLSRREALRGGVAALAAGAAVVPLEVKSEASPVKAEADAKLIRLGAELKRRWDAERPLWDASMAAYEDGNHALNIALNERASKAQSATFRVVDKIAALTATTMAGLSVKALAYRYAVSGEEPGDIAEELAHALALDTEALAEEVRS